MNRRVLFFSHETTLSGAPMQLLHLLTWLRERSWEVALAAPAAGPISEMLAARRVPIFIDQTFREDPNDSRLREICRDFDLVVANTIVSWGAIRAAAFLKLPSIWYLHETQVAVRLLREIPEIRPNFARANLLITPTKGAAEIYRPLTTTPIEVVPYGIPDPGIRPEQKRDAVLQFATLGSFEPRKGQDVLLEAVDEVSSFKIAGRILDQRFFAKLPRRKNVELLPALDHTQANALLRNSDALIVPSRDETMPLAILEAMSLSKAVITTDVGGVREWLLDGVNALVVPPENSAALAAAIRRLTGDRELLGELQRTARRTFEAHFTLEKFGTRFEELMTRPLVRHKDKPIDYADWISKFEAIDRIETGRQVRALRRQPLISIILPVYEPELTVLAAAIDSVKQQIYPRWELCIADDASTDSDVRRFLEEAARSDSRIKITFRKTNGHISVCSNSALALTTGEWCALLDQDDALAENALAEVAFEIQQHPDAGLIYSDEDKIDAAGLRSNPFFKTDWNPELFLGQNFINHLGVYRADLLREIGGFREGFEGSQDYDLALRCVARLEQQQIRHIPRILYHWRAVEGSLAEAADAKPYAKEAARRAIADFLRERKVAARVEPCPENAESHRVIYEITPALPLVSIVIPMRDHVELIERCLTSLRVKTQYSPFEIIVVDNGSSDEATLKFLREVESQCVARMVRDQGDFNFSRLINRGAAAARGEILALLNNDIEASEDGWLREMVSHVLQPQVGAVGARLWYPNGRLQHGGVIVGLGGVARHAFEGMPRGHAGYFNRAWLQQNISAVTAACMVVRKNLFEEVSGFDETNLAVSFNDVDFCLRLRERGLRNVWTPYANLIHAESASRGHEPTPQEQERFVREVELMQQKWGAQLMNDPFYNPNLSLNLPGFTLAEPPRVSAR